MFYLVFISKLDFPAGLIRDTQHGIFQNEFAFDRAVSGNAVHPTMDQVETAQKRSNAMSQFRHLRPTRGANCYTAGTRKFQRFKKTKIWFGRKDLPIKKKNPVRKSDTLSNVLLLMGFETMDWDVLGRMIESEDSENFDLADVKKLADIVQDNLLLPNALSVREKNVVMYVAGACQYAVKKTFQDAKSVSICPGMPVAGEFSPELTRYIEKRNLFGTLCVPSEQFFAVAAIAIKLHITFIKTGLELSSSDKTTVSLLCEITRRKMSANNFSFTCGCLTACAMTPSSLEKLLTRALRFMFRVLLSRRVKDLNAAFKERSV